MWCVDELTLEDQGPKSHPTLRTLRTNPPAPKVATTTTMSSCKGIGIKELLESWSFLAAPVNDVYRCPNTLETNKVNMDLAGLGNGCEMVQLALEIWIGKHGISRELTKEFNKHMFLASDRPLMLIFGPLKLCDNPGMIHVVTLVSPK